MNLHVKVPEASISVECSITWQESNKS